MRGISILCQMDQHKARDWVFFVLSYLFMLIGALCLEAGEQLRGWEGTCGLEIRYTGGNFLTVGCRGAELLQVPVERALVCRQNVPSAVAEPSGDRLNPESI